LRAVCRRIRRTADDEPEEPDWRQMVHRKPYDHPFRKTAGGELLNWQKEYDPQVNKIRWMIEHVISHFKNWTIMHTDYRLPSTARHIDGDYLTVRWPSLLQDDLTKPHCTMRDCDQGGTARVITVVPHESQERRREWSGCLPGSFPRWRRRRRACTPGSPACRSPGAGRARRWAGRAAASRRRAARSAAGSSVSGTSSASASDPNGIVENSCKLSERTRVAAIDVA
jgi:hypothetical protein